MKKYLSSFAFIILLTACKDKGIKATFIYDYYSNLEKKEKISAGRISETIKSKKKQKHGAMK